MKLLDVGDAAGALWSSVLNGANERTATENYKYVMDWATLYQQGKTDNMELKEAVEKSGLDAREAMDAYTEGVKAREKMTEAERAEYNQRLEITKQGSNGKRGSVTAANDAIAKRIATDEDLKPYIEEVRRFAEFFGVEVVLTESKLGWNNRLKKETYQGARGSHQAGRIEIDINSGKNFAGDAANGMLHTMAHEMTHFMRYYNTDGFAEVREFATKQITKAKGQAYLR